MIRHIFNLLVVLKFLVEIKDFFSNSGYDNALAYNLYRMNLTLLFNQLVQCYLDDAKKIVVGLLGKFSFLTDTVQTINPINLIGNGRNRSISKKRMNRFYESLSE